MMVPITRLTQAAANDRPNEIFSAFRVRRLVMMAQNWSRLSSKVLRNSPASGIRMMTESHVRVSPMVRPNPGKVPRRATAMLTNPPARVSERSVLVDLVENAAFGEVVLLRLGPTTENVVDGEKFDLGERFFVFPGDLRIARAIGIARRDFLAFLGIPILQIGFGDRAGALFVRNRIDDGKRRLGQDRQRWRDDLEFVAAEFALRQECLVLPGQQHVADAALDEGHGRAARAGIKHRYVLIEIGDEFPGLVDGAIFLLRETPRRQVIPARAARGLRVRRDDADARFNQIVPI